MHRAAFLCGGMEQAEMLWILHLARFFCPRNDAVPKISDLISDVQATADREKTVSVVDCSHIIKFSREAFKNLRRMQIPKIDHREQRNALGLNGCTEACVDRIPTHFEPQLSFHNQDLGIVAASGA